MMQKAFGDNTIGPECAQVHPTTLQKPDDGKAKAKILEAEVLRGVRGLACDAQKRRVWRNSCPGYWECLSWKKGLPSKRPRTPLLPKRQCGVLWQSSVSAKHREH